MATPLGYARHGGTGVLNGDRPIRGGAAKVATADLNAKKPKPPLKKVLPEVWALVKPRLGMLSGSFLIMIVNRASGLVLPASSKYLIDNVMGKHQLDLLPKIVGVVVAATLVQGATSYSLTQILSKAGQRLIAELRTKVQAHVGRLPVAFYDEIARVRWSRASCRTSKACATSSARALSTFSAVR